MSQIYCVPFPCIGLPASCRPSPKIFTDHRKEKEKKKPGSRLYEYLHIINIKIPATLNPMSHDNYSVTVLWLKVCIIVFGCVPARMSAFA